MEHEFVPAEETRLLHRLEQLLYRHPAVEEVAVLPSPHPQGATQWLVLVVPGGAAGGKVTLPELGRELENHCRESLPEAGPLQVRIVESLPRTPSGKLPRGWLYKQYGLGGQPE